MILKNLTKQVKELLKNNGIIDNSESEFLVSVACHLKRNDVYSEDVVPKNLVRKTKRWAKLRASGVPLTIISKSANFYGRDFYVNRNCLAPRPETEELTQWVGESMSTTAEVLDLCTGSGAIAITLNLEFGFSSVIASDISSKALYIAKKNAKSLGSQVYFKKSNLFDKINKRFDCIVSNPPYVSEKEYLKLDNEVKQFEPKLALVACDNGLEFYKKIIAQAPNYLKDGGRLFFEVGFNQAESVAKLLQKDFKNIIIKMDLQGVPRMVSGTLKENQC